MPIRDYAAPDRRNTQRFRRHRTCELDTGGAIVTVRLHNVSGAGAFVELGLRPPLGAKVLLRHPDAGEIAARVIRHGDEGVGLSFAAGRRAVTFALVAIAADMTMVRAHQIPVDA